MLYVIAGQVYGYTGFDSTELYMVSKVDMDKYALISLSDGNRWENACTESELIKILKKYDFEYMGYISTDFELNKL